jgi:hypothetical protein
MRRVCLLVAVATFAVLAAMPAQAAPMCAYVLGFAALQAQIPDVVGTCLDDERHAANGDAVQHTTGGLLVWRKADNWTAFTDGYWTYIDGPVGLARRFNTQRFTWEANPDGLPVAVNIVDVLPTGLDVTTIWQSATDAVRDAYRLRTFSDGHGHFLLTDIQVSPTAAEAHALFTQRMTAAISAGLTTAGGFGALGSEATLLGRPGKADNSVLWRCGPYVLGVADTAGEGIPTLVDDYARDMEQRLERAMAPGSC